MLGQALIDATASTASRERFAVCERAVEFVIDTAYDEWCQAASSCEGAWSRWLAAEPHARRSARVAYRCAADREEAAARLLARACAVAEEGFEWA
jgi:hypothetical protein